jgi:hypothetical protein
MKNYQLISLILCFLMTITAIKSWPEPINIHQLVHLFIYKSTLLYKFKLLYTSTKLDWSLEGTLKIYISIIFQVGLAFDVNI